MPSTGAKVRSVGQHSLGLTECLNASAAAGGHAPAAPAASRPTPGRLPYVATYIRDLAQLIKESERLKHGAIDANADSSVSLSCKGNR